MTRYHGITLQDEEADFPTHQQQQQQQLQHPTSQHSYLFRQPSLRFPDFISAFKRRASSVVSDTSTSSNAANASSALLLPSSNGITGHLATTCRKFTRKGRSLQYRQTYGHVRLLRLVWLATLLLGEEGAYWIML